MLFCVFSSSFGIVVVRIVVIPKLVLQRFHMVSPVYSVLFPHLSNHQWSSEQFNWQTKQTVGTNQPTNDWKSNRSFGTTHPWVFWNFCGYLFLLEIPNSKDRGFIHFRQIISDGLNIEGESFDCPRSDLWMQIWWVSIQGLNSSPKEDSMEYVTLTLVLSSKPITLCD